MEELELPEFPQNELGLKRGTILTAIDDAVSQLGMKRGDKIILGFDGKYIRCQGFTWSIEQITTEIEVYKIWKIDGEVDLSDPARSLKFAQDIEGLFPN